MNSPLIFRNRDFLLLWTSQVLSQAGNRMFQIAVAWWILSNVAANSGLYLALFMVFGSMPAIFLVKWIGSMIDRHSSKWVLLTSDILGTLLSVGLVVSFQFEINIYLILASGLLFAVFQGFIEPTLNKAVPELVADQDISNAVAFLSSTQTLANFAGAVIGAVLIDKIGIVGVALLNGASYFFSAGCDGIIRFKSKTVKDDDQKDDIKRLSGWKLLDDKPLVRKILITFGCVNFFGTPILVILPLYTKFVLNANASTLGVLEACIWLGLLTGTFASPHLRMAGKALLFTAFCLFGFALFLAAPSLLINQFFYGACLTGAGFALGAMNVRMVSLFQQMILNEHKGRFFALLQALVSFAIPFGYFTFAALSDVLDIRLLCVIQGLGVGVLAIFFLNFNRFQDVIDHYKDEKLQREGA